MGSEFSSTAIQNFKSCLGLTSQWLGRPERNFLMETTTKKMARCMQLPISLAPAGPGRLPLLMTRGHEVLIGLHVSFVSMNVCRREDVHPRLHSSSLHAGGDVVVPTSSQLPLNMTGLSIRLYFESNRSVGGHVELGRRPEHNMISLITSSLWSRPSPFSLLARFSAEQTSSATSSSRTPSPARS